MNISPGASQSELQRCVLFNRASRYEHGNDDANPQARRQEKACPPFEPDGSQRVRRVVQWLFVALNGWLGIQFLLWVRYCERGGSGLNVPRPAGAEG